MAAGGSRRQWRQHGERSASHGVTAALAAPAGMSFAADASPMTHTSPPPPPISPFHAELSAPGPHLLDVTMFWESSRFMRRLLAARHAALTGLGWRHTVMAPAARGPSQADCGGLPLPGTGGCRLPFGQHRLAQIMVDVQPDLIEVADPFALAGAALRASRRLQVPVVACCFDNLPAQAAQIVGGQRGLMTPRGRWAARRVQAYIADLYGRFDAVLAPTRTMTRRLQHWGVRQAHHQPLGVDCSTFNPQAADPLMRRRIEHHLGATPRTKLLVFSGRFTRENQLELLAEAVNHLGPHHMLLAVGEGDHPPRGAHVRTLAPMANSKHLARLLANADLYLHAGMFEIHGAGVLEAMACGLPTLVNGSGGLAELAANGAITVPGWRARDWAATMADALESDLSPQRSAGLAHAVAHDHARIHAQLVQRYHRMIGNGPAAAPASSRTRLHGSGIAA